MSLATYIVRRQGSARYYLRMPVPLALRPALGKNEIWESLRTTDPREARELAAPKVAKWRRTFAEMRQRQAPTEPDLQQAIWDRYNEILTSDERFRQSLPTEADLDEIWQMLIGEFDDYDIRAYRIFEAIRDRFEEDQQERAKRVQPTPRCGTGGNASCVRRHHAGAGPRSVRS